MRNQFWNLFVDVKYASIYLPLYRLRLKKISNIIDGFSILTSASSIAAWYIWDVLPALWSTLIAISQAIQLIKPLSPVSKRLAGLDYAIPELRSLADEMEIAWNRSELIHDSNLFELFSSFRMRFTTFESKYFESDSLPDIPKIQRLAMAQLESYLALYREGVKA